MGNQHLLDTLTERERDISRLIADGLSNHEIAQELVLTHGTVKWYCGQIYSKLGVNTRCGGQKSHPRPFSRSGDLSMVMAKFPGAADLTLALRQQSNLLIMAATSLSAIIQDLPDALFGDTKDLSQRRYRLAFFVASTNFSIAFAFGGSAIGDGEWREF